MTDCCKRRIAWLLLGWVLFAGQAAAQAAKPLPAFIGVPFVAGAPVVYQPPIEFPTDAARFRAGGSVTVAVLVGADGAPERFRVIASDPPLLFDRYIVAAMPDFRFATASRDGKTARYETHITFNFSPLRPTTP
ncbi:MAG: TonB family protein [Burkholderiales bacterium]|nr:TonB family protein [Burkholderiales bacterium]